MKNDEKFGGYLEYYGRCVVRWRDIMIHVKGYPDTCGGISSVPWEMFRDVKSIPCDEKQ